MSKPEQVTMTGRRRDDVRFGDLPPDPQPGDYWRYLTRRTGEPMTTEHYAPKGADKTTNLTGGVWGYYSPDGNGLGTLVSHTVREHDDGTISVLPGDGSSNSIKHEGGATRKVWHGYIRHGVWGPV